MYTDYIVMYNVYCNIMSVFNTKSPKNFFNYIIKIRNIHQNNFSTNNEIIKWVFLFIIFYLFYLGCHVSFSADPIVQLYIDGVCYYVMSDSQSEIANRACAIRFHKDVLRLEIPVSNGGLPLSTDDLHVKMRKPGSNRQGHPDHTVRVHGRSVQIIEQRTFLVIICD